MPADPATPPISGPERTTVPEATTAPQATTATEAPTVPEATTTHERATASQVTAAAGSDPGTPPLPEARELPSGLFIRRARTPDVKAIRGLVEPLAEARILVAKDPVNYFESLQEFRLVVDRSGPHEVVVGCAALHVLWDDLAEARTVATHPDYRGRGIGRSLMEQILADARDIGVSRVFCLTFETRFFQSLGFEEISGTPVSPEVYVELLHSHDEGTAEFLDLARVKPNTLGNSRMLKHL